MNKITGKLVLLLCLFGFAPEGFTQQQAGAVVQEIHRRSNPNHPGYVGNNAATPVAPREVWQSKYGAVAIDWNGTGAGAAESENSMRAARRVALQKCGSKSCEIVATTANGCLAGVHGTGKISVAAADTRELAIERAMSRCHPADGSRCELRYAYCSFPVRIR